VDFPLSRLQVYHGKRPYFPEFALVRGPRKGKMTSIMVLTDPTIDASRGQPDAFFTGAESCFLGKYG